jgi:membrane associated rhomboid family serine protease
MTWTRLPFSNAVQNLRQIRHSPASLAWAVSILLVHGLVTWAGGMDSEPAQSWFENLGLSRAGILNGKFWQILTYGFLHGGWLHVGLNALFVVLVGSRIEHMAGPGAVSKAILGGVIGGGLLHLIIAPTHADGPILVGLSGGCIALLLLLTTLSPDSRMMPLPISGRNLGLGILIAELILTLINPSMKIPIFADLGNFLVGRGLGHFFQIAHACHLGGGLTGWILGRWLLRPRVTLEHLHQARKAREANDAKKKGGSEPW